MKLIIISVAAIALLGAAYYIGTAVTGGTPAKAPEPQKEEGWADKVAAERKATYEKSQANKDLSVGDTADVRGFKITVTEIQRVPRSPQGKIQSQISPTEDFVALDVTFSNEGDIPVTFSDTRNFRFVDDNGSTVGKSRALQNWHMIEEERLAGRPGIGSRPFEPGQTRHDVFLYALPKEGAVYLEYTPLVTDFGQQGNAPPNKPAAARWHLTDNVADLPSRF